MRESFNLNDNKWSKVTRYQLRRL